MEPKERIHRSRKRMMIDNFLGGISWALGVAIGGSIVLALLGFVLSAIDVVPIVGTFIHDVVQFIDLQNDTFQNPPQLPLQK